MHFRRILTLLAFPLIFLGVQEASAQRVVVQKGNSPYEKDQLSTVVQWTDRVVDELEHLQDDIAHDLRGEEAQQLYRQADQVLTSAMHFQRTAQEGKDRDHIYRDFQSFDQQLHRLFKTLENAATPGMQRHLSRIHFADDQLHRAISVGDPSDERRGEVITRQAHALDREAEQLDQLAARLHGGGRNQQLHNAIHDFAEKAAHFHETVENDEDPHHAKLDFSEIQQSWSTVVQLLNSSEQSAYLYRQARRVEESYNELAQRLTRPKRGHEHDHAHPQDRDRDRDREHTIDLNGLKFRFRVD
jgi:hypothetical protein